MNVDPMDLSRGMRVPTASARRRSANRGLWMVLFLSLVVHAGAIGGVVFAQSLGPRPVVGPNAIPVQLVRLGKPRDPKLLPRRTRAAVAPPPPPQGVALDTGKPSKARPRKPKKTRRRTEDRLSAAARRMLEGRGELDNALSRLEEAEGSPDGDPMGTTTDPSRAASGYQAAVVQALRARYDVPKTIPASQLPFLSAEVVLFIGRDGRILRYEFVKSHPNAQFMSSLNRMLKTVKLPPPPRGIASQVRNEGWAVTFSP